jgi:hypothetical protein
MKTKKAVGMKKQTVTVKDLKTRKNPKGGSIALSFTKFKYEYPLESPHH